MDGTAFCFQFFADTVNAFAKLLDILVCPEELGYLRIAREMRLANVVWSHYSRQISRSLEDYAVIEHLYSVYLAVHI